MTELIEREKIDPLNLFTKEGVEPIIREIERKAKAEPFSVESAKGRDHIASIANKVARSKTFLDNLGKELVADQKKKIKIVDNSRKLLRDSLDELKAERKRKELELKHKEEMKRKEQEKKEAVERAKEQERKRQEKILADQKKEDERRARDKTHKANINNIVLQAIEEITGLEKAVAKQLVKDIALGKVPHIKIIY